MIERTEIAAGCVVLQKGAVEPEILLIWNPKYSDPRLPKGRVESNEAVLDAALREVKEETGYDVACLHDVPLTLEVILDRYPPIVQKTIHWFPAKIVGGAPDERVEKQLRVGWLPVSEALLQLRRVDEVKALQGCLARVATVEQNAS